METDLNLLNCQISINLINVCFFDNLTKSLIFKQIIKIKRNTVTIFSVHIFTLTQNQMYTYIYACTARGTSTGIVASLLLIFFGPYLFGMQICLHENEGEEASGCSALGFQFSSRSADSRPGCGSFPLLFAGLAAELSSRACAFHFAYA